MIIKFRAFENGQMYYQVQAGGFLGTVPVIYVEKDGVSQWVNSTGENPVMQFTNLLDKNGKEIYEGDIAEITYNFGEAGYTEIGVMEFNQKYAQFGFLAKDSLLEQDYEHMTVKVIGNVWENPDLLTKGVKE